MYRISKYLYQQNNLKAFKDKSFTCEKVNFCICCPAVDTDLNIIVKISDHNLDAFRRIDLDVYTIELRANQIEPIPSEKDDLCPICCKEFGTEGDINSLNCEHSYHHHCILDWVKKSLTCPYCKAKLA